MTCSRWDGHQSLPQITPYGSPTKRGTSTRLMNNSLKHSLLAIMSILRTVPQYLARYQRLERWKRAWFECSSQNHTYQCAP